MMSEDRNAQRTCWGALILRAAFAGVLALMVPATALAAEVRSGDTVTTLQANTRASLEQVF